jgi:hypothetical protein
MKTITTRVRQSTLAKNEKRAVKGVRGFAKAENPKDKVLKVKVTNETKEFFDAYCAKYEINVSQMVLAAVEWYTGFDGTNGQEIMKHKNQIQ